MWRSAIARLAARTRNWCGASARQDAPLIAKTQNWLGTSAWRGALQCVWLCSTGLFDNRGLACSLESWKRKGCQNRTRRVPSGVHLNCRHPPAISSFQSEWHRCHDEVGTAMFLKEEVLLVQLRRRIPSNKVDFEWQESHIPRTVVTMEHKGTLRSSSLSMVDWWTGAQVPETRLQSMLDPQVCLSRVH
jgi:hypothetical protein